VTRSSSVGTSRATAGILVLLAALLYLGVAWPVRRALGSLAAERRTALEQRDGSRKRLAELERRERALKLASPTGAGGGTSLTSIRRSVLASLDQAPLSGLQLSVRPAPPPLLATIHFSGHGAYADVNQVLTHLVRPGSGVVLSRVSFRPDPTGLSVDVDAQRLGDHP
jgi:hypothetical protein